MKQERMILGSTSYPTIQCDDSTGILVPVEDIPMMSDEQWRRLTNTPEQKKLREKLSRDSSKTFVEKKRQI